MAYDRLGVVCASATATLNLIRFGVSFVVVRVDLRSVAYAVSLTQCRSPKGGGKFLILHYIDKAGELESESWKSLRDGQLPGSCVIYAFPSLSKV